MRHLAVFVGNSAEKILSGEKTVDGRFSRNRIPPFGCVARGDKILLKPAGENIVGEVEVENVLYFNNLTPEKIDKIKDEWGRMMVMSDSFWLERLKASYASLIFLTKPRKYLLPEKSPKIKKGDRRSWVLLS